MPINDELLRILENPTESLSSEVKRWFDPSAPEGVAKIAKGCLALYNSNGGLFIVGFNDDGSLDISEGVEQIRPLYTQDRIQGIVSKYSSGPYEVEVINYEDEKISAVIIVIPSGIKTPAYVKSELIDGQTTLIKNQAVFSRSLDSNGTPSSSEIRERDWERFVQTCVDNREADIGRFISRHLTPLNIESIRSALVETGADTGSGTTLIDFIREYLDEGETR
jgi:predicted HTH transcriptional regulator